ncbi:unnamed protein product, partial [Gulo gulo]
LPFGRNRHLPGRTCAWLLVPRVPQTRVLILRPLRSCIQVLERRSSLSGAH